MAIDFEERAADLELLALSNRYREFVQALRQLAADVLEEAAKECDEVAQSAADDIARAKKLLGKGYDHNSYGAGHDSGCRTTADSLAEAIRARATAIKEGKQ